MKNKKKTIIVMIPIIILIIISGFLGLLSYNATKKMNNYFDGEEQTAILPMVTAQEDINRRLEKVASDSKYTFESAYVELNPYKISPLSAIIIYTSKTNEEVEVYINDTFSTKMESTKKHIIPIYGLYEDRENTVKLVVDDKEVEYTIKTEASNIEYPLNVEVSSLELNDEIYFLEGSMETGLTGWDKEGNLRFYLTELLKMDVEWLDNGHFIVGTDQGNDEDGYLALDRYVAFVEMDYLGKIYNYYVMPNGYDFESQVLSDGTIMIGGGNTPIYFDEQVVYTFDTENKEITSLVNLSQIIKGIDENFDPAKLGPLSGKNGFYYNEETNELVVSFRNLNALISFNYIDETINWVFTDPENTYFQNEVWEEYFLQSTFYPHGQHSPQILANGDIAYFDNNYDRVNVPTTISEHKGEQSEAIIIRITDKKVKLVWSSKSVNEGYLTQKYGLFRVLDNGNKLIDFGWIVNEELYNDKTITFQDLEGSVANTHGVFLELDSNDNILFKASCEEGKYRIFKHVIYNDTTSNISLTQLGMYNGLVADTLEEKTTNDVDLDETVEWINSLEFTQNTFYTDFDIKETDEVKLYFVNKGGKISILTYKSKDSTQINRVFNVILNGKYALYIDINGVIYDTKKVIQF